MFCVVVRVFSSTW